MGEGREGGVILESKGKFGHPFPRLSLSRGAGFCFSLVLAISYIQITNYINMNYYLFKWVK